MLASLKTAATACVALVGFSLGAMIVTIIVSLAPPKAEEVVICPPLIEAAERFRLFFEETPPEPGPLDYEFLEACGFEEFTDPVKETPVDKGT